GREAELEPDRSRHRRCGAAIVTGGRPCADRIRPLGQPGDEQAGKVEKLYQKTAGFQPEVPVTQAVRCNEAARVSSCPGVSVSGRTVGGMPARARTSATGTPARAAGPRKPLATIFRRLLKSARTTSSNPGGRSGRRSGGRNVSRSSVEVTSGTGRKAPGGRVMSRTGSAASATWIASGP